MDHDVCAVLQWATVDRRRERGVDHQRHAVLLRQHAGRTQVHDTRRRVHRRLEKEHAGIAAHRLTPRARFHRIDKGDVDPHRGEFLLEKSPCAAVQPAAGHEMIARPQQREHRAGRRGHAAREHDRRLRAFQRGESAIQDRRDHGITDNARRASAMQEQCGAFHG